MASTSTKTMGGQADIILDGYLLKKKRRRMQGYARRWFFLSSDGHLTYAFKPDSAPRGSLFVPLAFVHASRRRRALTLDAGKGDVFHVRALSKHDFEKWSSAVAAFSSHAVQHHHHHDGGGDDDNYGDDVDTAAAGVRGRQDQHQAFTDEPAQHDPASDARAAAARLAKSIAEIEAVLEQLARSAVLATNTTPSSSSSTNVSSASSLSSSGSVGSSAGMTRNTSAGQLDSSAATPVAETTLLQPQRSDSSSTASGSTANAPQSPNNGKFRFLKRAGSVGDYFDKENKSTTAPTSSAMRTLSDLVATLKAEHGALTNALRSLPPPPSSQGTNVERAASRASSYAPRRSLGYWTAAGSSRASTMSVRSSPGTTGGGGGGAESLYEDARGEFVLSSDDEEGDDDDAKGSLSDASSDVDGASTSSLEAVDESREQGQIYDDADDDDDDEDGDTFVGATESPRALATRGHARTESTATAKAATTRRDRLPAPISGDELSLLGLLRKNVGKDLSAMSFPVTLNEPISALQRSAEELEYSEILDRASVEQDPKERLLLMCAYAVSACSNNKLRSSRKPFTPLLGETFECVRPDRGLRFVAEKVSHVPFVMAFHAESLTGDGPGSRWRVRGQTEPSQKFWGRSIEILTQGRVEVDLTAFNEVYTIRKPSSFVRNLVAGTKYLELVGTLHVDCVSTGASATIKFKEGSSWGGVSSRNKIEGKATYGSDSFELVGRWDDRVEVQEGPSSYRRLWECNEFPHDAVDHYGFSSFAIQLNEISDTERGWIAPTDSRYRPDIRALEEGDVDTAESEKKRLEEKQRKHRLEWAEDPPVPRFFNKHGAEWVFAETYFDERHRRSFYDPDLF